MRIRKCVWCGGEAKAYQDESVEGVKKYEIDCKKCGFILGGFDTKSEAIREWNGMIHTADSREFGKATEKRQNARGNEG